MALWSAALQCTGGGEERMQECSPGASWKREAKAWQLTGVALAGGAWNVGQHLRASLNVWNLTSRLLNFCSEALVTCKLISRTSGLNHILTVTGPLIRQSFFPLHVVAESQVSLTL